MKNRLKKAKKFFHNSKKSLKKIKPEIWLIIIIILALTIRLNFFLGMNLNDDECYANRAYNIVKGKHVLDRWIFSPRIMMHYPIAFFYMILGVSDFSATLYILLCSLGSVAVSYFIGKTLFNPRAGLVSAFLMSFFPIEVIFATTLVPDPPVAFFMGLSVCLFLLGEKKDKKTFYFLGGLAIGLGWLVKSLAVLIILFYIVYFLFDKIFNFKYLISNEKQKKYKNRIRKIFSIRKGFIITALGFLLVILLEGLMYYITNNDFFLRFDVVIGHYTSNLAGCNFDLSFYPNILFSRTSIYFDFFSTFFVIFGACTFLLILFEKNKKYLIPVIWLGLVLLWMQYGTMNPFEYVLMHRLRRFLTVITLPISITIGYFIAGSNFNKKRLFTIANIIIISALIISSFYAISKGHFFKEQHMKDVREISDYVEDYPDKDIYADAATWGHLKFLLGYERNDDLKRLKDFKNSSAIKDAFVIVNGSSLYVNNEEFKDKLPDYVFDPPEHWRKVKIINATDFQHFADYDPIIYYAPP